MDHEVEILVIGPENSGKTLLVRRIKDLMSHSFTFREIGFYTSGKESSKDYFADNELWNQSSIRKPLNNNLFILPKEIIDEVSSAGSSTIPTVGLISWNGICMVTFYDN